MAIHHPFPTRQITVLSLCRVVEPIAFTSVFPYLYFMLHHVAPKLPDIDIVQYVTLSFSLFAVAQFLTGIFWGRLADIFGRKPIFIIGLCGTMMSSFGLAFSTSINQVLIFRALTGLLSGNVGIVRTMMAEMTKGREHQARAFSINAITYQIGFVIGPVLGGTLVEPCDVYKNLCGPASLLGRYPYALPNIVIGVLLAMSIIGASLLLNETLEKEEPETSKPLPSESSSGETTPLLEDGPESLNGTLPTKTSLVKPRLLPPQVIHGIISYAIMSLHTIVFDQLFPVFLSSPPSPSSPPLGLHGGLGIPASDVGISMAASGALSIFLMTFIFTPIDTHFGTLPVIRLNLLLYPATYFALPYLSLLSGSYVSVSAWSGVGVILFVKTVACAFTFTQSTMLINDAQPTKALLGTVNGVAQTGVAVARAVGPLIMGAAATLGQKWGVDCLGWWVLALIAAIGAVQGFWLKDCRDDEED